MNRWLRRLLHRDGSDTGSSLCFYDTISHDWIRLTPGQHIALIGVSGSGKSNLIADLLVNLSPHIDDGTALVYGIDLKGGIELDRFGGCLADLATTLDETVTLLERLNQQLDQRMRILRAAHKTSIRVSRDTPMILVVVDEAAELTGGIDKQTKQQQERIRVLLDRLLRLGRACKFTIQLASQDPRKESMPLRDRCPTRIALRLNSIEETKMLLGDSAVQAGAAPWLIGPRQPGTGYIYDAERNRAIRFHGQQVPDDVIKNLRDTHPTRIDTTHDGQCGTTDDTDDKDKNATSTA